VVESQARALGTVDADDLLMRAVDVLLAFPTLLLLLAIGALVDRTSELTLIATLAFTGWPAIARVVRSKALEVLAMPYVEAARALGGSNARVLFRHVAPATLPLLGVLATNAVAAFIVAEAALAFLGLSVPPPQASWGRMLEEGRPYVSTAPWLLAAPATALFVSVLGFHLLTEGVADGERDER
jgi:peptide/nickel transport system permease protein